MLLSAVEAVSRCRYRKTGTYCRKTFIVTGTSPEPNKTADCRTLLTVVTIDRDYTTCCCPSCQLSAVKACTQMERHRTFILFSGCLPHQRAATWHSSSILPATIGNPQSHSCRIIKRSRVIRGPGLFSITLDLFCNFWLILSPGKISVDI